MSERTQLSLVSHFSRLVVKPTINIVIGILVLTMMACSKDAISLPDIGGSVIQKAANSDGSATAYLLQRSVGGATVGFQYQVVISGRNKSPEDGELVVVISKLDSSSEFPKLSWEYPYFLKIRYGRANISHFSNFAHVTSDSGGALIEIALEPINPTNSLAE